MASTTCGNPSPTARPQQGLPETQRNTRGSESLPQRPVSAMLKRRSGEITPTPVDLGGADTLRIAAFGGVEPATFSPSRGPLVALGRPPDRPRGRSTRRTSDVPFHRYRPTRTTQRHRNSPRNDGAIRCSNHRPRTSRPDRGRVPAREPTEVARKPSSASAAPRAATAVEPAGRISATNSRSELIGSGQRPDNGCAAMSRIAARDHVDPPAGRKNRTQVPHCAA